MILPTSYFAPLLWYKAFLTEPCQIEVYESFPKQTYRNRCSITSPNGKVMLSVPVCKVESKQLTKDVKISYQQHWQHQHKVALVSAYKRTPFFDYYQDFILAIYDTHYKYLIDLNNHCHSVVMDLIDNICPKQVRPLPKTLDWQGQELEWCFQTDNSILDLLMEYGPQTKDLLINRL